MIDACIFMLALSVPVALVLFLNGPVWLLVCVLALWVTTAVVWAVQLIRMVRWDRTRV